MRRTWAGLLALVLLAVTARAGVIWQKQSWRQPGAAENRQIAKNIVAGDGFSFRQHGRLDPTSVVAPVYPFLLASLYAAFGGDTDTPHQIALALNLLFAAATVPLIFWLTRGLFPQCRAATWCAALLFAAWPTQIFAATLVQPLVLAVALTFGVLLLATRAAERPTVGRFALLGAAAGLLALIEGSLQFVALAIVIATFIAGRRREWVGLGTGLMAFAVVIGPWLGRNYVVHGRFVPIEVTPALTMPSMIDGVTNLARTVLTDWLRPGIPAWYVAARGALLLGTVAGALVAWRRGRRDMWVILVFYFVFLGMTSALLPVTARTGAVLEVAQLPLAAITLAWLSLTVFARRAAASLTRQQTGEGRGEGKYK